MMSKRQKYFSDSGLLAAPKNIIVFIWSQNDGGNVEHKQWLRFPPKPYDAKAKYYYVHNNI